MPNPSLANYGYGPAAVARGYNTYGESLERAKKQARSDFWKKIVLPVAAIGTGGAAAAFGGAGFGLGAANTGAWTLPAASQIADVAAPAIAKSALSKVPWLRLGEIGVNTVTGLMGGRKADQAAQRAQALEEKANAENMAFLRDQESRRRMEWDQIQSQDRQAYDADQEQRRLDRLAADEDRAYGRSLSEAKEGRRAPYRQVSQAALMSLANIGRRS